MRRGEEVLSGGEERDLELDRERLVPGLVDALIGLTPERRGSSPSPFRRLPAGGAAGVTVEADTHILAIRERELPPLDDALAQRDGSGETLEAMRDRYRDRLVEAAAQSDEEHFQSEVLKASGTGSRWTCRRPWSSASWTASSPTWRSGSPSWGFASTLPGVHRGNLEKLRTERRPAAATASAGAGPGALASAEQLDVDESQVEHEVDRIGAGRRLSGRTVAVSTLRRTSTCSAGRRPSAPTRSPPAAPESAEPQGCGGR